MWKLPVFQIVGFQKKIACFHQRLARNGKAYVWFFDRKTYTWSSPKSSHSWNPADFTMKSGGFHEIREIRWISPEIWWISPRYHLWNPPKIIKASVSAKTLQFDECRVGDFTLKSGGFHLWNLADFTQISPVKSTQNYKRKCFSKNSSVWWMQGGGFHPWNPVDFTLKSGGFHLWNLADFTQILPVKSTQNYKSKCFSKNSSVWWMQGGGYDQGFHEIHQISPWNLADLTCEIQWISPRYHLWNPPKIIKGSVSAKILQFDECRVGDFTLKSGGFQPWNLVDFTQISPVKSTQNYKSKCFSKNSSVWWMQGGGFHPWNPVDFNHEIWWISPRYHLWNPPKIIKGSVSAKTLQFDECRVGVWPRISWNPPDFTLKSGRFDLWNPVDFTQISPVKSTQNYKRKCFCKNSSVWWMQGGGFHPEIWWISTMKSGGFHPDFTCEIHPKL